jgi:hypothetical protein
MLNSGQARFFNIVLAMLCLQGCRTTPPQIAGTWSGEMMIDGGTRGPTHIKVTVTFTQHRNRIGGQWRSLDAARPAAGEVFGTLTREQSRQAVDMRFTFTGRHPLEPDAGGSCRGAARSVGQLTYNTTVDTAGRQAHEPPGWGIRLKAFDGLAFESCPAIRYATWTLTRQQ